MRPLSTLVRFTLVAGLAAASGCGGDPTGPGELHLSGTVTDVRGIGIPGATVRIDSHPPSGTRTTVGTAVTDASGAFTVTVGKDPGYAWINCSILWIEATADGYGVAAGNLTWFVEREVCDRGEASVALELVAVRPGPPVSVVVIVEGPLTAEDSYLMDLLSWAGHDVAYRTSANVDPADSFDFTDVVVVARSATSFGTDYLDAPVGMVLIRGDLWAPYRLSASSAEGPPTLHVTVTDPDHPIAAMAGLATGSNEIAEPGASALWRAAGLAAAAQPIAYDDAAEHHVLFAYEAGSPMVAGHVAAGRRAAFGFFPLTALNRLGEEVLLAAVQWAAAAP